VTHIGPWSLVHEGCIVAVGFGEANLIRNVGVDTLVSSSLGRKGRIVLLHHLLLHADVTLLLVSLLIADHLQILDFGLGSRRKALLHTLASCLERALELFTLVLVLDYIGLAHGKLGDSSLHLACKVAQTRLEFVDLLRDLESGLATLGCIALQFLNQVRNLIKDKFLLQ
jgi:hypothetical protein